MDNDFSDIKVIEDNPCDFCGREIEPGEEIEYQNSSHFDVSYLCPRCYEEVQTNEPLEM